MYAIESDDFFIGITKFFGMKKLGTLKTGPPILLAPGTPFCKAITVQKCRKLNQVQNCNEW